MTTRLLLVRHAHARCSDAGVVGGPRGDTGLSDRGRNQAEKLRDRLAGDRRLAGAALYSSTLPRAVETAAIVAPALGASGPQRHCGLCSWHFPERMDGRPVAEVWADQLPGGGVYRPYEEGNEAFAQVLARAGAALFEIAIAATGGTALVVGHVETVEASLVAFGELPIRRMFDVGFGNVSITEWETDDDPTGEGHPGWRFPRWRLVRLNDTAHLG